MAAGDATLTETDHPAPPPRDEVVPGTRLGRYEIEAELGRGGMGIVYRARDDELGRGLAIKLLQSGGADRARQLREARAVANLRHPAIVTVYDVGTHGDELFIAMELVDGTTLRGALEGKSWRDVVAAYRTAGAGLAAAHEAGIVHRDFKPDNVLVGGDGRVVVTDFGIASAAPGGAKRRPPYNDPGAGRSDDPSSGNPNDPPGEPDGVVDVTVHGGTPSYMSPEQLRGEAVDARSDQFSFCVALYAALYGVRPFPVTGDLADLRRAVEAGVVAEPVDRRGVPAPIEAAVRKGLATDPARRHASMAELLAAIAPRQRSRARWWVLGVAALGVAAGVVAFTQRGSAELVPFATVASRESPVDEPLALDHEARASASRIEVPAFAHPAPPIARRVPPAGPGGLPEDGASARPAPGSSYGGRRFAPPATGSGSARGSAAEEGSGSGYKGVRGEVMESYPGGVR